MNKVKDIIKSFSQKKKILGGAACFLLAIFLIGLGISYSDPNSSYLSDQEVDGLSFKNANLVYEDGISKYTVEVENTLDTEYSLKTINVVLRNSTGDEIETLIGYIGEKLSKGERKLLDISIDKELTDIVSIEYTINK